MPIPVNSILYVDDDTLSLTVMKLLLVNQMQLPHVTMFENSANFLERVQSISAKPDVILLDIHIKPLSGLEMLKLLRENGFADSVIIALTASVMNQEVIQLKTAGFNGVIAKPVNVDAFPELLGRILNKEQVWAIT
jgi:CheY-like chemotaxis protein